MPLSPRGLALAAALAVLAALPARASIHWDPVSPAELNSQAPALDPDAPAEALFRRITIDDSDFPLEREVHEYVRYRILDPEKAARITRIAQFAASVNGDQARTDIEINARLTNPDGSVRSFGRESIQEKPILRSAGEQTWVGRLMGSSGLEVNERFLAVTGVEKGAVLDIQTGHLDHNPGFSVAGRTISQILQMEGVPERQLQLLYLQSNSQDFQLKEFALNSQVYHAVTKHDGSRRLTVTAQDVPALYHEPFSGPAAANGLEFLAVYSPVKTMILTTHSNTIDITVDPKKAPWASVATPLYIEESDMGRPTTRVTKLSATITTGLTTPEEKAAAIHRYVRTLYQRFVHRPTVNYIPTQFLDSIDQVLDFDQNSRTAFLPTHFLYLEIGLLRAAGLEVHAVALANLNNLPFDPRMVASAFLPDMAARVRVGDEWKLSCPIGNRLLAFGEVPWECEGAPGLIATPGTQEFFPVPTADAAASAVVNAGTFTLSADGGLRGEATRSYTGHSAEVVRQQMARMGTEARRNYLHRILEREFRPAHIGLREISGDADPESPLVLKYAVNWADYASVTQDRLIFHPAAFRVNSKSPFADATRHYDFQFPYAWTEQDHVIWTLPEGYQFESPRVPPSMPGDALSYKISMARETKSGRVHCDREFASSVTRAKASAAGALKQWYDGVAARDQFELVLRRTAPAPKAESDAAP